MFRLSIVSPERTLFEDDVHSLIVPGTEGYIGILSHHAPLISTLKVGKVTLRDHDNVVKELAISGDFFEVSDNKATILAETVEFAHEIDPNRAELELHRAEEMLNMHIYGDDLLSAKHSLAKAKNRIDLYKSHH